MCKDERLAAVTASNPVAKPAPAGVAWCCWLSDVSLLKRRQWPRLQALRSCDNHPTLCNGTLCLFRLDRGDHCSATDNGGCPGCIGTSLRGARPHPTTPRTAPPGTVNVMYNAVVLAIVFCGSSMNFAEVLAAWYGPKWRRVAPPGARPLPAHDRALVR
jgi:hypothetical protein